MDSSKFPIGIQDFEKIRREGLGYVDKTSQIHYLVSTGCYYFLSRPRRFGKSLLISTLKAFFEGRRDLFKGLAIDRLATDWTPRPVLHLDLNTQKYETPQSLTEILNDTLRKWEALYGAEESEKASLSLRFLGIIRRAHAKSGQRVAILVDEYDKPLLQAIGNDALETDYRNTLKAFYGALKSGDAHIQFALLTVVTKFGKISVFSDLNNLQDISMSNAVIDICGLTETEITANFEADIRALADAQGLSYEDACRRLREDYDGYHFEHHTVGLYNPFSVLSTLKERKFASYWFETGTPTFLVQLLRQSDYDLTTLPHVETGSDVINSIYADNSPIPVLYQSGYLTIKDYDSRFDIYTLGFPNREVEEGFCRFLVPFYTSKNKNFNSQTRNIDRWVVG